MNVIETREQMRDMPKGWALTIGNFDGVHRGHQQILQVLRERADEKGARGVAVMTFYPHPAALIRPDSVPGLLTPLPMRKHLLAQYGVDCMIILSDDYDILSLSPKAFVDDFLMTTVEPIVMAEGPNFSFGYGRSGDVQLLKRLGEERGFGVLAVGAERFHTVSDKAIMYSSTLIRNSLERGDVRTARKAMNRYYRLVGPTVKGRGIGKKLGYPTANIDRHGQVVPAEGVYAGFVNISDSFEQACVSEDVMPAAFSIGRAKTFVTDHPLLIETHVLGREIGDLSGKWLGMDFVKLLRGQERFENEQELKYQIDVDCRQAMETLENPEKEPLF